MFVVSPTPWALLSYHTSVQNRLLVLETITMHVKDSCLMILLFLLRTNLHDKLLILLQDYEYASFNPVAYDIANHFCEMAADYHSPEPHILDYRKYPGIAFF
jgi:thiamine kinase-like enzyme